jgi:hypothetical protein
MLTKLLTILAMILAAVTYWAMSNVCNYNSKLERSSKMITKIDEKELGNLGQIEVVYANDIQCEKADLAYDLDRLVKNVTIISKSFFEILEEERKKELEK